MSTANFKASKRNITFVEDLIALPFMIICWLFGLALTLAAVGFWIWMLIDCATKEPDTGNDKITWIIIIALTNWIGALIYYFVRRPERIRQTGR